MTVKVKLDEWMRLPRLGTDSFKELMKAGVRYDSGRGFLVPHDADLQRVKRAISGALKGAPVEFVFTCFICGREMTCEDCEYHGVCSIDSSSPHCICSSCAASAGFDSYVAAWRKLSEARRWTGHAGRSALKIPATSKPRARVIIATP